MAELVGGALLGLAFSELWNEVKKAKHRLKDFKPQLTELERTLRILDPQIQEMRRINTQLNNELDHSEVEGLTSIMEDGKELVSKCHDVSRRWLKFFKKSHYQKKLVELDNKLIRFNIKYMQPSTFLEVNRVRLEQSSGFNRISEQIESLRPSISSAVGATTSSGTAITTNTGRSGPIHPLDGHDLNLSYARPLAPPPVPRAPSSLVPLPVPNRAPSIGTVGLINLIILPSVSVILKISTTFIIIYKAMIESGIWMVIKDVGMLKMAIEQLDATMKSLAPVLEEIESNGQRVLTFNEADRSEDAKRLRSLLEEGRKLVFESSNIGWWNFVKNWQYQKNMVELDNKLLKFHSLYLQGRFSKNNDKTDDDSEMKDDDESFVPAHYDEHRHEMEGRHNAREHKPYSMLNNNPHQFSHYKNPPSSIGAGSQQYALGR